MADVAANRARVWRVARSRQRNALPAEQPVATPGAKHDRESHDARDQRADAAGD
jgi:hypothetical protein